MRDVWEIPRTSLLPSVPGPLRIEMVAPDRGLSIGLIELFEN